ncbi:MAG TPA: hypothetical protein VLA17_09625, partial [Candidatus Limnocylindria bacterium]|nr:hypothetical protein [Candidatus Limnocylindria bacterium]
LRSLQPKIIVRGRIILLLALMIAAGLGGGSVAYLNQAAGAAAPGEKRDARFGYEHSAEPPIAVRDEKNHSNAKGLLPAAPAKEAEAKRLQLIFLIMMSLGHYRTPVR